MDSTTKDRVSTSIARKTISIQYEMAHLVAHTLPGCRIYVFETGNFFSNAVSLTTSSGIRYLLKDGQAGVFSMAVQRGVPKGNWEAYASLSRRTWLRDDIGLYFVAPSWSAEACGPESSADSD